MSARLVVVCDTCGALRGEGNRWLSYIEIDAAPLLIPFTVAGKHACGDACFQKVQASAAEKMRAEEK